MSKYTKGPWTVESDRTTVTMGGQCCIVSPGPDDASREEIEANARLISTSPELLSALKRLADCPAMNEDAAEAETIAALEQARAVIAKAEGRTNAEQKRG